MTRPDPVDRLSRWPLLLASALMLGAVVGLDLTSHAPVAYALLGLAAASLGAFLYAEGARHREWWERDTRPRAGPDDDP